MQFATEDFKGQIVLLLAGLKKKNAAAAAV